MSAEQETESQATDIAGHYSDGVVNIIICKIDELTPNPNQPRKYFEEEALNSLSKSLIAHGFINPITIAVDGDKKIIIAGEQRWKAAQIAKIDSVPCIIKPIEQVAELSIVENLLRSDLTAIEKAEALKRLLDESGISQRTLAKKLGKKESTISEILKIASLPDSIKDKCRNDRSYAIRQLKKIATAVPEKQEQMFEAYKSKIDIKLRIPSSTKRLPEHNLAAAIKLLSSQLQNLEEVHDVVQKNSLIKLLGELKQSIEDMLPETSTRRSRSK
ncbi:ParB/RepB/Spo0J family partition protein [Trichlorobacter lovleyi]|uniref:ParB/RepB/Spo0J family partition protein n=1 Tax=Trichlorobacter lovleyi TaxID=313985 RepID=UPI003D099869